MHSPCQSARACDLPSSVLCTGSETEYGGAASTTCEGGGECKLDECNLHVNSLVRVISPVPYSAGDWEKNMMALRQKHAKAGDSPVKPEIAWLSINQADEMERANKYALAAREMNVPSI